MFWLGLTSGRGLCWPARPAFLCNRAASFRHLALQARLPALTEDLRAVAPARVERPVPSGACAGASRVSGRVCDVARRRPPWPTLFSRSRGIAFHRRSFTVFAMRRLPGGRNRFHQLRAAAPRLPAVIAPANGQASAVKVGIRAKGPGYSRDAGFAPARAGAGCPAVAPRPSRASASCPSRPTERLPGGGRPGLPPPPAFRPCHGWAAARDGQARCLPGPLLPSAAGLVPLVPVVGPAAAPAARRITRMFADSGHQPRHRR